MEEINITDTVQNQSKQRDLRTYCLFCWREIDLDLDRRGKPYVFCGGCGTRVFMSRATLDKLKSWGLAWSEEPPLEKLEDFFDQAMATLGLRKGKNDRQ